MYSVSIAIPQPLCIFYIKCIIEIAEKWEIYRSKMVNFQPIYHATTLVRNMGEVLWHKIHNMLSTIRIQSCLRIQQKKGSLIESHLMKLSFLISHYLHFLFYCPAIFQCRRKESRTRNNKWKVLWFFANTNRSLSYTFCVQFEFLPLLTDDFVAF